MSPSMFFAAAAALALAGGVAVPAAAQTTKPVEGVWSGEVSKEGRAAPVPFMMTLNDAARGQPAGQIVWGAPFVCKTVLQFSSLKGGTFLLTPTAGDGPHCDSLVNGHVDLTPAGAEQADVSMYNAKNKLVHQTQVERAKADNADKTGKSDKK